MKIKPLIDNFKMPVYGSKGAAAFDIYTPIKVELQPLITTKVPLGFAAAIPEGFVGLIAPRSGLGCKHGMSLKNTIAVIDSDYRGEWVANLTADIPLVLEKDTRILQCMIVPINQVTLEEVNDLDETERGEGGFGSSGLK